MIRSVTRPLLLAALLAAAAAGPSPAVPATPPPPQPMQELRFPAFAERTLANGLRVVTVERHNEPAVTVELLLPAGALFEPAAKAGLASAAADLLTKGTASRSAQQIAAAADDVGGQLETTATADFTLVTATFTADQLSLALDLVSDVVLHPTFPADEIERWRHQATSNLAINKSSARWIADTAFQRAIFGAYPYGAPLGGTTESVAALTRDDLVAFQRAHYLPNGAILAVAGDFQPAAALAAIDRTLGGWARGAAPPPPALNLPAYTHRRIVVVDKPDAVQTEIRVGQAAYAYGDPDLFVGRLYATVLGGGSSFRLFQEIRRKRGLAYGAYSSFAENLYSGSFTAFTSTKTASTVDALELTLEVIAGMAKEPVPAAELNEAKTYLNGSFPLEIETAPGVTRRIVSALAHGRGRDFLDGYRDRIGAVSAAEIQRFAGGRIHPDSCVIVLVGNAAAFGADLSKRLGAYETIPAADFDPLAVSLRKKSP
jgi:zinc protease